MPKKKSSIRPLIDAFPEEELRNLCEQYAGSDKNFEAFLVTESGEAIATHKTLEEFRSEVTTMVKKAMGRSKLVKITRLEKAGLKAHLQMARSHLLKGNPQDALFLYISLIASLMEVLVNNTRSRWGSLPSKKLLAYLDESKAGFDSSLKIANPLRKDRQPLLELLLNIYGSQFFAAQFETPFMSIKELLSYAPRDEDLIYLGMLIKQKLPLIESDYNKVKKRLQWHYLIPGQFDAEHPMGHLKREMERLWEQVSKQLQQI